MWTHSWLHFVGCFGERAHHSMPILGTTRKLCSLFFKFYSVLYIKTVSVFKITSLDFPMQFNNLHQQWETLYNTTQKTLNWGCSGFVCLIASFFFFATNILPFFKVCLYLLIWFTNLQDLWTGTCPFPLCDSNFYTASFTTQVLAKCNLQLF